MYVCLKENTKILGLTFVVDLFIYLLSMNMPSHALCMFECFLCAVGFALLPQEEALTSVKDCWCDGPGSSIQASYRSTLLVHVLSINICIC